MFNFNKSLKSFLELNHVTRDIEHPIKVYDCEDGKDTIHICMTTNVLFISLKYQEKWSINNIIASK